MTQTEQETAPGIRGGGTLVNALMNQQAGLMANQANQQNQNMQTLGQTPTGWYVQVGTTAAMFSTAWAPMMNVGSLPLNAFGTIIKPKPRRTAKQVFALIKRCWRENSWDALTAKRTATAAMVVNAKENGQTGLYEEMSRQLASLSVEAKLLEAGFATYIDRKAVDRFTGRSGSDTYLTAIENFGRHIPDDVATKLQKARDSKLFSGFTVLHAGMAMVKTTAQKIREKDPILFGVVASQPDRLYVIADWIDEWCHLTLSELVVHPEFTGSLQAVDVDEAKLAEEVAQRDNLLATTRPDNWRENERAAQNMEKLAWYTRVVQWLNK